MFCGGKFSWHSCGNGDDQVVGWREELSFSCPVLERAPVCWSKFDDEDLDLYAGHDALLCLRVFLGDGFFFSSGEFVTEFLEKRNLCVACSLPADFFFAPFRDVLESFFGCDDDREHPPGDHEELFFDGWCEALSVPECFEVEEFADAVELNEVREFRDGVRDDVCAIAALVPGLFADEFFGTPEEDCLDDDAFVEVLVKLVGVFLPFCGCVVAEGDEVLLRSLADGVWEEAPGVLVLCQVGLSDELLAWVL